MNEQESRTERVAVAVTPTEARRIKAAAILNDTDVSNLLRSLSVEDAVTEGERAQAAAQAAA